jgi:hypothetical protein
VSLGSGLEARVSSSVVIAFSCGGGVAGLGILEDYVLTTSLSLFLRR